MRLIIFVSSVFLLNSGVSFARDTFVYCSEGSPSTFNPQLANDGPTFNASAEPIYNRLVTFEYGGTKIIPSLAESWQISKDGKDYTLHLRKNVQFHKTTTFSPTRPLTADDVLFSFDRMRNKKNPYHLIGGGTYEYYQSLDFDGMVQDIVKVDDSTVKFRLKQPAAVFLSDLAMDFAVILSAEYADQLLKAKTPEKLDMEPVGTGPFVFKRYSKDTQIRYEAFEKYFDGAPAIKKMVFVITPDASVRFQKLKTGECDLIAEPAPQDLEQMKSMPNVILASQSALNVGYLAMNVTKPPLDKAEVRQAIAHALNRKLYVQAIYQGEGEVAKNPIPPTMWSYNKSIVDYDYNPTKARELLKKAGFANGFETELWTLPVARPYNPNGKKMGELMQADLAKVGIKAKIVTYDWPTYLAKTRNGEHQMVQMGWTGDNGDPDNFLNGLLSCEAVKSGANDAEWCDREYSDTVNLARSTTDMKKRIALYQKAQVRFHEMAPWVTIAHAKVYRAMQKSVHGYKISPFGVENFAKVTLAP